MDLTCNETVNSGSSSDGSLQQPTLQRPQQQPTDDPRSRVSRVLYDPAMCDDRAFANLLRAEERRCPAAKSYFETVQDIVTPHMRAIVAQWMFEVCEEQQCHEGVFTLAMTYLDRFMGVFRVCKNQLQVLGSACLLLASKFKEPSFAGLDAELLVHYTDSSITIEELFNWELLVLSKLKWDLADVIPHDFLEPLIRKVVTMEFVDATTVAKQAQAYISLAVRDYHFASYPPSTLAAACVALALHRLEWHKMTGVTVQQLLKKLRDLTNVELDYLQTCLERIHHLVQCHETPEGDPNGYAGAVAGNNGTNNPKSWPQPQTTVDNKHLEKATTPTDLYECSKLLD